MSVSPQRSPSVAMSTPRRKSCPRLSRASTAFGHTTQPKRRRAGQALTMHKAPSPVPTTSTDTRHPPRAQAAVRSGSPRKTSALDASDTSTSDTGKRTRRTAVSEDEHAKASNRRRVKSSTALRLPRLLQIDKSQYTEEYLPTGAQTTSHTTLAELAHLIRVQGYQEKRRCHARVRLHRWLVSKALSARLVRCGELAKYSLIEAFRSDDRKAFSTLYNAIHDVRNSCDATRRYSLLEPELEFSRSSTVPGHERQYSDRTFLHEIPHSIREELLAFVSALRTDPDFLVQRIASLSGQELKILSAFRPVVDPVAVLARPSATTKTGPGSLSKQPVGPTPVERLLSFQRHDPFSTLFYSVFASSSGPESAEDLRRTEIWSTVCAKLIADQKQDSEGFLYCILDAFAEMREWPAKNHLELYLMQTLQDGHFLLDRPDDLVLRTRAFDDFSENKVLIRTEEFFESAINRLFKVIDDDPVAGGIPEGVLEIGLAIYRKIQEKKHRTVLQRFIVHRWFFAKYLTNAIVYPEHHGIMTGYHISDNARKLILKPIAMKAQRHVLDTIYKWQQQSPVPPVIRTHVESIFNRFKENRKTTKPMLLPAKAITSPRETVEVQPFIVLCPADLITLVNALFPEKRPLSSHFEKSYPSTLNGVISAGSSISGLSTPFAAASTAGDGSSVLSMCASSVTSETTSRAPLLDGPSTSGSQTSLEISPEPRTTPQPIPTEKYGHRLRHACSEMKSILGSEAVAGNVHPCAERWAVVYVSPDGKRLRLRARKDVEDDDFEDETTSDDSEEDEEGGSFDGAKDYHQLKIAISQLVQEWEIPKELVPDSESKEISNRDTLHPRDGFTPKKKQSRTSIIRQEGSPPQPQSHNPYLNGIQAHVSRVMAGEQAPNDDERPHRPPHVRVSSNPEGKYLKAPPHTPNVKVSPLVIMLEAAVQQCQARSDFVAAELYHRTLQRLRNIAAPTLTGDGYAQLLNIFSRGPRDSIGRCASALEEFDAWFVWLKQAQERTDFVVESMMVGMRALRDKMWYVTDVRHSAVYEDARSVALALRSMGQPVKLPESKDSQQKLRHAKPSANPYLLKQESQILEVLAASIDMGGPNKLGDEQSEMTSKWLMQLGIENFCKGEERIHRFCLEVDRCLNKLVGENVLDAPVLWASDLFRRDKEVFDSGRDKGDLLLTGTGALSIAGDEDVRPKSRLDFVSRASMNNLRSAPGRNSSQPSLESLRGNLSKPLDLLDSQDYFGTLSPVLTMDSNATYWSPNKADTATLHVNSVGSPGVQPRTLNSSSRSSVVLSNARSSEEKQRFLLGLKQTLTGLLLSDIGAIPFGEGCETDGWFSGELGKDCVAIKESEERRRKRIARKKSMKGLKSAGVNTSERDSGTDGHSSNDPQSTSTSSDAISRPKEALEPTKSDPDEFPYHMAFQRLLRKFATHPNPFTKLRALTELQAMIVASLSSKSSGKTSSSMARLSTVPQSPVLEVIPDLSNRERQAAVPVPSAQNLTEVIANVTERRSASIGSPHALLTRQNSNLASPRVKAMGSGMGSSRAGSVNSSPSTDMIVDQLQSLFRDTDIRPKTLFRDLQYISAFVPGQMLDDAPTGQAFWNTALAALRLKQDICRIMIEVADDIVALNIENRSVGRHGAVEAAGVKTAAPDATPGSTENGSQQPAQGLDTSKSKRENTYHTRLQQYSMADAAKMLIIAAKEGDAVAERELATFYLTHPELLPRTLLPLTKPKDVFKADLVAQRAREKKKGDGNTLARADPMTMCVAQHWMEASRRGGDVLATKYLRSKDDLERIP